MNQNSFNRLFLQLSCISVIFVETYVGWGHCVVLGEEIQTPEFWYLQNLAGNNTNCFQGGQEFVHLVCWSASPLGLAPALNVWQGQA